MNTVTCPARLEGVSWQHGIGQSVSGFPSTSCHPSRLPRRIFLPEPSTGFGHHFQSMADLASCVPPSLKRRTGGTGILNLFPIIYAFRPRLRGRLTLGGRTFPRKSQDYGVPNFHRNFRYSCPHDHFHPVHVRFPSRFAPDGTLFYHFEIPKNFKVRGVGSWFKSRSFSARDHSTSQLLRTV